MFSPLYNYLGILGAVIGLIASLYIYRKKQKKEKMVCPRTASCDTVVHSTFATSFGIPNDVLGIAYYVVIGALYAVTFAIPSLMNPLLQWVIVIGTAGGVLFSVYLVAVQLLRLHTWCAWCMLSAFANVVLLVALFYLPRTEFFSLLASQKIMWVIVHNVGFIFGIGAATITDILFFRFLQDSKISEQEKGIMDILSSVIWVGLAILVVSGVMLYLPEQSRLLASSKFLLKIVVVSVITVNGVLLNIFVAPKMRMLSFADHPRAVHFRRAAFALGGVSIVSWYTAFLLGSLRSIPLTFTAGLIGYLVVLFGVIAGSQVFERIATKYH